MGFSKKDLGDVVWSSEAGRDTVFLTSRPKDIDYPQLLSIQTLDRRTTGATLFQMERRPFIRSGLVQAETAYRRTNTNVSRSEMPADPMGEHHNPDPNSKTQRKLALVRAARQYAKQYTWRTKKDPLHSNAEHRRATRNLLRAASSLPGSQHRRTIGTEHGKLKPAISHLLGAAHGYRTNPSKETRERLLAIAVNWYNTENLPTKRRRNTQDP